MTGKRHDFRVDYKAGFDAKGRVIGVDVDFLARCGYSADLSNAICDRTMFHADNAYFYPAARIATRRLRTNTVSNTAFRGFGGPQGMIFAERMMEVIAIRTGQRPARCAQAQSLRRTKRDVTPYGMKVEDNIALDDHRASSRHRPTIARAARRSRAFNAQSPVLKKGISLTPVKFGISFTLTHLNQAGALVHVYTDGSVHLNHGGTEMGQGLYTKVAQVVAEEFGIDARRRAHHRHDHRQGAQHLGHRGLLRRRPQRHGGEGGGGHHQEAPRRLSPRSSGRCRRSRIRFEDGQVLIGNRAIAFGDLARQAHIARISLSSTGYYATPKIPGTGPRPRAGPSSISPMARPAPKSPSTR